MSQSQIFLFICLSFIGGIFLNLFLPAGSLVKAGLVIFGILLISIFWRYKKITVLGFCILFLVLGVWRHQQVELRIMNNELRKYNDQEKIITLVGMIAKEPDIREKSVKLTVQPENINGKILVTADRYTEYQYGDKLKIIGRLKTPAEFEDFNYRDYLKKDGIYSVMDFPKIELIEENQGNFIYIKILAFKEKLRESIYQNLSPPQSSLLGAMILGDKSRMSGCSQKEIEAAKDRGEECLELKEKLNITGVRHITAISGMHITILSIILMQILIGLGLWRSQAFYLTMALLILFIVMIGLPPSAIRAGIMGGLFLLAQYLGRMNISSRAIVFAATMMLAHNPLLLKLDIGFQLSFLAMMGIIYLVPIFQNLLSKVPDFFQLKNIFVLTISAQIFTLPILIYNFGYVSTVAPIVNILVVPLLSFVILSGFIFGLAGMIFLPLGQILSWFSWLLLTYLVKIVDFFSQIPPVYFKISWVWLSVSYLILGLFIWRFKEKQKLKFLKY